MDQHVELLVPKWGPVERIRKAKTVRMARAALRSMFGVVLAVLALTLSACRLPVLEPDAVATTAATVARVSDGDTITVMIEGVSQRVRLLGIDAPEDGMCGAEAATARLTELVLDRAVDLVADTASDERDRYDRILAYVETDGTDIGAQLISEGLVSAYWPTSSPRPDRGADYVTIETEARDAGTGSWAMCGQLGRH